MAAARVFQLIINASDPHLLVLADTKSLRIDLLDSRTARKIKQSSGDAAACFISPLLRSRTWSGLLQQRGNASWKQPLLAQEKRLMAVGRPSTAFCDENTKRSACFVTEGL